MISLLPNTTAQDTNGVFALLAMLKDPAASQQLLTQLTSEKLAAQQAIKDSEGILAQANAAKADIEKREQAIVAREKSISADEVNVSTEKQSLTERETKVAALETAHGERVSSATAELEKRQVDLDAREKSLDDRDAATAKDATDAAALQATWQRKMDKLKAAQAED